MITKRTRSAPATTTPFPIVGVGASAGGLEAFTELLKHLPPDTGMGFVLVQHLDPQHESTLPQLLARATTLAVSVVSDKMRVAPNHVYVIPPNASLTIARGILRLAPRPPKRTPARSIDVFLESLAADQRECAIGVILSGTASDGTIGLEAIKAEGGITFAQDESARYDSMPRSAVTAGCVDFVLSPENIAYELARIAKHPYVAGQSESGASEEDRAFAAAHEDDATPLPPGGHGTPDTGVVAARAEAVRAPAAAGPHANDFKKILLLLRNHSGVDFSLYKSSTIQRRIARRMVLVKQTGLDRYARFLRDNKKELDALYTDVLISVTSFFRSPEAFDVLRRKVFPKLLQQRGDDPVRVWVLGCSTGQEAYSIAMAFTEAVERAPQMRKLQVFATDLNDVLLDKARHGLYGRSLAEDIEPERLRRFFVEEEGGYRVVKALREMVVFARQNVIVDPPFSRMDLVSCRNLLIYLEPSLQKKIIPVFHYALKPNGFLFLGSSESVGTYTDLFESVDKKHKIFSKKAAATPALRLPVPTARGERPTGPTAILAAARPGAQDDARGELIAQREADRIAINQFVPPSVLIDGQLQILQFRGPTGAYLKPPTGKASFDVLKMAREGLMLPLRAAINSARKHNQTARKQNVRVEQNGGSRVVDLEVIPLKNLRERCFLIVFQEVGKTKRDAEDAEAAGDTRKKTRSASREDAHRIAELESTLTETRDYLQSIQEEHEAGHEELQASNEEVQSANEELQSINEELETSKEELESANEELATINEEMASRNAELGRANSDLVNLQTSTRLAVLLLRRDLTIRSFSAQAEKQFHLLASDIGRRIATLRHNLVFARHGDTPGEARPESEARPTNERRRSRASGGSESTSPAPDLERFIAEVIDSVREREREVRDESGHWFLLRVRPYLTLDNKVDGAVVVLIDIDELKRHAQAIADARDYAEGIVRTVRDPLVILDAELRVHTANETFYDTFEISASDARGRLIYELGNRQWDIPDLRRLLHDVLPQKTVFNDFEVTHDFPTIGRRTMLLNARKLSSAHGEPDRILLGITDVTEQKETANALQRLSTDLIEADRRKNEFLAMLAHELRNPLAPIRNALDLKRRQTMRAGATADPAIDMIDRQVVQLVRLVDDLLDVSRITRGRIELRREAIELTAVVARAVEVVRPLSDAMGHELTINMPPQPIYLYADDIRLTQIIGNLLTNASKFTNEGGHIELLMELDGRDVVIRVRDNGIGIDPGELTRVFDLFMQGDMSATRSAAGLGIGLSLVRQLVELHGGTVEAHSEGVGHGSEFIVRLPTIKEAPLLAEDDRISEIRATSMVGRLLIVDDNRDATNGLATLLASEGLEIRTAHDGLEALKVAESFRPDVIVMDIGLPNLTGYEVARRIRGQPWGKDIVLIALTGWGQAESRNKSREAGFNHHLVKPVETESLARLLSESLRT